MKRLTCIVEGKGEVRAIPNICSRILSFLGATDWCVDQDPVRQPRSRLVDESVPSPNRGCTKEGLSRALELASTRKPSGILVLCDSDDDCPCSWGGSVVRLFASNVLVAAVMAVREYEAWILANYPIAELKAIGVANAEKVRDAKGALSRLFRGYKPTVHQLMLTRAIDIARVRRESDSFDKMVRDIGKLCGLTVPSRDN